MGGEEPSRPARRFARNAGQLVRLHTEAIREAPLVALLPLVLFSFCVTGGVVAVRFAALSYANSEKEVATALLASVTTVRGGGAAGAHLPPGVHTHPLELSLLQGFASLLETTLYPMLVVQKHIESGDAAAVHASAQTFWTKTAPSLIALSPAIDDIQLAPYGVAVTIYPLVTARRNATSILALGGHDLLNASSPIANRRAAALLAITTRGIMIEGPKSLLLPGASACTGSGCATIDPLLGILARQAMFVQTPNANDAWSGGTTWPGVLPGQVLGPITGPTNCSGVLNPATGLSVCALNATGDGTKFWGFTTVIVIWSQLLDLAKVTALGGSNGQPYQWSVSRSSEASLGVAPFAWVYTSSNTGALPAAPGGAKDALFASATVFSSQWGFTLQKPGGWRPVWERGVIAGVVLMSALIALSLYLLALERRRHLQLLFSMLPARMVRRMRGASGGFAESFPHAVILFSDIVSYTDLVSVLTPDQVMVMLNELFGEFDALVDKHGVVKGALPSGDAWLAPPRCLTSQCVARAQWRPLGTPTWLLLAPRRPSSQRRRRAPWRPWRWT